jgi:hypothetical protein
MDERFKRLTTGGVAMTDTEADSSNGGAHQNPVITSVIGPFHSFDSKRYSSVLGNGGSEL